ncbi:sulfotransferase domain-containing protein [Symplocastrum sp. BBK-W-15]|uniref:Sulfotransferase domain-containing protein n=2 Tax=Limnofasciculus TaxID=3064905 RepID=A0AAE3GWF4_9CYAN|nr:sulfotransferase domain-containing protein [Limnofasciculus baicalensis BBK-W-15]
MNTQNTNCQQYLPPAWSSAIFAQFDWKAGDVVISSAAKQGTTWMQNIVHQLRTGGDADFEDINEECPRPEFVEYPGQEDRERLERWENGVFKKYPFRAIKTHAVPPKLPFEPQVKYIIPVRNGKDSLVSFYYYRNNTTEEFRELWGGRPFPFPSFDVFFDCYLHQWRSYWNCINAWLPYRHSENVLFIHYADLKRDLEGNLNRIANFLDLEISSGQWLSIIEKCGFQWMRDNSHKFESRVIPLNIPILNKGGMIRKGKVGDYRDLFTPEQEIEWDTLHQEMLPDEAIRNWCDNGGKLP